MLETMNPSPAKLLEDRLSAFREVCRQKGLKVTHQRLAIYREIITDKDHPDAETVFRRVRKHLPTVSLDTVYRTLWTFMTIGVLEDLGPGFRRVRFDPNTIPHHHFICTTCETIMDFCHQAFDALPCPDELRQLGRIDRLRVEGRGICRTCFQKMNSSTPPQPEQRPFPKATTAKNSSG